MVQIAEVLRGLRLSVPNMAKDVAKALTGLETPLLIGDESASGSTGPSEEQTLATDFSAI